MGPTTDLSAALRLFKGPRTPLLRSHAPRWQKNFNDHRLRVTKKRLPTVPLHCSNPYRANFFVADEKWPRDHCAPEDRHWFGGVTNESVPIPAWLR
ncbi:MAG: hypothetical protein CK548_06625 [Opitutia bacterium]|nr:hypothetical protein [Opitutaceae bacterium]PHX71463.1 MAG: hypothetical protein CK548_06625 [Opitutae bacterium]